MSEQISLQADVPVELGGKRLDQILAQLFPDFSRSRIKTWILDEKVTVNGDVLAIPKEKLLGGEVVAVETQIEAEREYEAQDIALDIVYEDDDILVINKPMGLVVHPGAGNPNGTVLNALLHHHPEIINVPRAGIVHRLDKDTTGLMVVAKTIVAQTHLVKNLQARENFTREYEAICNGTMTAGGMIEKPIGRHATKRTHMAIHEMGKPQSRIIGLPKSFGHIRVCVYVLKPVVPTRSVYIWLILSTRWWVISFMVAVLVRRAMRRRSFLIRSGVLNVRHCMR